MLLIDSLLNNLKRLTLIISIYSWIHMYSLAYSMIQLKSLFWYTQIE